MFEIKIHLLAYVIIIAYFVLRIINEFFTTSPDHYVGRPFVIRYIIYIIITTLIYGGLYWY